MFWTLEPSILRAQCFSISWYQEQMLQACEQHSTSDNKSISLFNKSSNDQLISGGLDHAEKVKIDLSTNMCHTEDEDRNDFPDWTGSLLWGNFSHVTHTFCAWMWRSLSVESIGLHSTSQTKIKIDNCSIICWISSHKATYSSFEILWYYWINTLNLKEMEYNINFISNLSFIREIEAEILISVLIFKYINE